MAKDEGRDVSIHLKLADGDFSEQFSKVIGGLTDQLNRAGKQFAAHMGSAEESIKGSTAAIKNALSANPGEGDSSGDGSADQNTKAVARANKLIRQMEKESIDAAEGASRVGREYEEVYQVVQKLTRASKNLKEAGASGKLTDELSTQNRLRKQSQKTINQLIKKIKDLGRTEKISKEQADEMLQTLKRASAQYSDESIKAEKAIQSVRRKSMSEFRRMMRARVDLVDALPEQHKQVLKQLRAEKQELLQQVEANKDNVEALERYRAVQKTIDKVQKSQLDFREEINQKLNQRHDEKQVQEQEGAEMAYVKDLQNSKKRVAQELDEIEEMVASKSPFERLKGSIFGGGLQDEKKELQQLFNLMDGGGKEAAEGLLKTQRRRVQLLEEEMDRIMQVDMSKEDTEEVAVRLNNLEEDRMNTLRSIENTEEEIERIKNNQATKTSMATGRRQRRKNMKDADDGSFERYNAGLQMSRLVQDAPYGFMGIVNNLDMAYESMGKLIKQSDSLGKALKGLFFGAGAASGMLWVNMLSSAAIVLNKHLDLTAGLEKQWGEITHSIFGAGDAIEDVRKQIDEVAKKSLEVVDQTSLDLAVRRLQEIKEKIAELYEQRSLEKGGAMGGNQFLLLKSLFGFNENINQIDEQIEKLEKYEEVIGDFVGKAKGTEEAYEGASDVGILTVEEHGKVLGQIQDQKKEILNGMMGGLEGEEAIPIKKQKIKLRYEELGNDLAAMMRKYQGKLRAAREAGAEEEVKALEKLTSLIYTRQGLLEGQKARELANLGEDGDTPDDQEKNLQALLDLRRSNIRSRIELEREGYEERRALARQDFQERKESLRESQEEFMENEAHTAEERAQMREQTSQAIANAEEKLQEKLTTISEEQAEERITKMRENQKRRAEARLKLEQQRVDLTMGGADASIADSRLQMEGEQMKLERQLRKAKKEGDEEEIALIQDKMEMSRRLHEQRTAQIRQESQARSRQQQEQISQMMSAAETQGAIINTYLKQQNGEMTEMEARLERFEIRKRQQMSALRSERNAQLNSVDDWEQQAEDTAANEQKAKQKRLQVERWFRKEKENIIKDFQEREKNLEKQHARQMSQMVGRQLSSNLGNISQALNSLQKAFVQERKQALIEQGVAEEEAARRAEEAGRRRFAIKKKIAIAEAMVNTYQAAMQVYRNTPGTLAPKLAAAAAALTYGFAQVAKIRAQSIGNSSGQGGGGVSVSGLGSSTDSTGSQVTDPDSPFASTAGLDRGDLQERASEGGVEKEVKGLRGDMQEHTRAIKGMKSKAVIEDDTAIKVGDNYQDHKEEDRY